MRDMNMQTMISKRKKTVKTTAVLAAAAVICLAVLAACDRVDEVPEWDTTTEATPTPYETGVFERIDAERELIVHSGNSMRPGAEALAAEFQRRYGIAIRFNFGGSAELLSSIELGQIGDLYLPHDPYAEMLEEKGLLERYEVVGYLEPVIVVPKGNPAGVGSMRELATRDLDVGLPDARYATAGRLVKEAFEDMGLLDELEANISMEGRSHNDVALGVLGGHLDAAMVWNFIATHYEDRLDTVEDLDVEFPEIRVTLCLLTHARDKEAAGKFMEFAVSETGQEIFEKYGYIVD